MNAAAVVLYINCIVSSFRYHVTQLDASFCFMASVRDAVYNFAGKRLAPVTKNYFKQWMAAG